MTEKIKLFIVVNRDLHLSPGQIAAQVSHVTHSIVDGLIRLGYEEHPIPQDYVNYMIWSAEPITIIKKATTSQLQALQMLRGSIAYTDEIFHKPTLTYQKYLTAVGFYPGSISPNEMMDYDLL